MRGQLIILFLWVFSWLPLRLSHAIGAGIGCCMYFIPSRLSQVTSINLQRCFPEWNKSQRKHIALKSLIETGKSAIEIGALWRWQPSRIQSLIKEVSGEQIYQKAVERKKGVIILTPHLGAWELTSLFLTMMKTDQSLTALYRPQQSQALDTFILNARQRTGAHLVPTSARGVKALYHALKDKQRIGILPDQDPGNNGGVFAPFFGISANTMALVSRLAHKSGAPVIYIYAERLPKGKGYHLHFQDTSDTVYDSHIVTSATAINEGVEKCVREHPEQYQWSYRRFKTRPKNEAGFY
jgi:KDO2-lipid IV(A) lauroyltransferase